MQQYLVAVKLHCIPLLPNQHSITVPARIDHNDDSGSHRFTIKAVMLMVSRNFYQSISKQRSARVTDPQPVSKLLCCSDPTGALSRVGPSEWEDGYELLIKASHNL